MNALNAAGNPVMNLQRDVDAFTRGYIMAALWTEEDELKGKGWTALAPETLKKMMDDCAKFQRENKECLAGFNRSDEENGHDFWLTRNNHGAGFWDRYSNREKHFYDVGEALTEACKRFGETWIYLGDDGKIYSN